MQPTSQLALLGASKTRILLLLRTEGRTAGNVASNLNVQVSAARKHLDQMVTTGLVSEAFQAGTVGRPKKFYRLTQKGKEMFPRAYDALLNNLTALLAEQQGSQNAEAMMRELAREAAEALEGDARRGQGIKQFQKGLNEAGFEAILSRLNGDLTVISRNCPVWKVALNQGEVVCRGYHAELLKRGLKGAKVEREEWMVDGDSYCKHIVKGISSEKA